MRQAPPFAVSFWIVAETFYKFHGFTLKCLTFLAAWSALDAVGHFVRLWGSREEE